MSRGIFLKCILCVYILRYEQTQQGYQFWIYDFIFCFYADNTFSFPNVNNILCVYECIFILFYQKHPYSAMGNSWAVSYVWKCFSAFFFYFFFLVSTVYIFFVTFLLSRIQCTRLYFKDSLCMSIYLSILLLIS